MDEGERSALRPCRCRGERHPEAVRRSGLDHHFGRSHRKFIPIFTPQRDSADVERFGAGVAHRHPLYSSLSDRQTPETEKGRRQHDLGHSDRQIFRQHRAHHAPSLRGGIQVAAGDRQIGCLYIGQPRIVIHPSILDRIQPEQPVVLSSGVDRTAVHRQGSNVLSGPLYHGQLYPVLPPVPRAVHPAGPTQIDVWSGTDDHPRPDRVAQSPVDRAPAQSPVVGAVHSVSVGT